MKRREIHPFDESDHLRSKLTRREDIIIFMEFLRSREYVLELLKTRWGLDQTAANSKAEGIISHVKVAIKLAQQGLKDDSEVSYLPLYYSALNFVKAYLCFSKTIEEVFRPDNKHHGATYYEGSGVFWDNKILFKKKKTGAIPMFYEALMKKPLILENINLGDVYSFIPNISGEYNRTVLQEIEECSVFLNVYLITNETEKYLQVNLRKEYWTAELKIAEVQGLTKMSEPIRKANPVEWISKSKNYSLNTPDNTIINNHLNRMLLHHLTMDTVKSDVLNRIEGYFLPFNNKQLELPASFATLLALYHMSNVVRYDPQFLAEIQDSKVWPVLLSLKANGFLDFLEDMWSFMHKKNLRITH